MGATTRTGAYLGPMSAPRRAELSDGGRIGTGNEVCALGPAVALPLTRSIPPITC